jgi:uncharacterized membrane protein
VTALATVSLVAATIATGLTAGLLYAFAHTVMPGLGRTDDRTFVGAFQAVDRAVINPWFMAGFLGGPAFTLAALLLDTGGGAALGWLLAALGLHVAVLVVTMAVNVPMNNWLQQADLDRVADLATARRRFETRWVRWNVIRTAAAAAAGAALTIALATRAG